MQPEVTTTPTGTSLQVLAPYLPYGIEVALLDNDRTGKLLGLSTAHTYQLEAIVLVETDRGDHKVGCACSKLLPILRPFSQLCDPLPDGTVPAVEVAKLVLDLNEKHCPDNYLAGIQAHMDIHGDCGIYLPDSEACATLTIYNDWLIGCVDAMIPPTVYDYLRRHHFAVNLEPHQYIAKA